MRDKTVDVAKANVRWLGVVTARSAADLSLEMIEVLVSWCGWQRSDLWDGLSLQEILNVYRATAEWDNFEGWAEEDWRAAYKAWNSAVINPGNKMQARSVVSA